MEHIKYIADRKHIKQERGALKKPTHTYICGSPDLSYVHEETTNPFILSSKLKRYNLQQIHCNFLFALAQSPLYFSLRIEIYIDTIQFPHI